MISSPEKLIEMQLDLLRSIKHITDEKQLSEVKSLLNFYFRHRLDESIDREENKRAYTVAIYEQWLNSPKK